MEVLLTCDESDLSKICVNFWNPTTGTKLLSLRGPPANPHSLTFIRDEGILVVEAGKPFIHFWQAGHTLQSSRRILCPGKPGTIAMSPDASFLAVAIEEKIYIWQVATGRILSVLNSAHYRPVTVLKFTDDGTYLVSGGQDGMILAWRVIAIISGFSTLPKYSWTDHSFPITDIHIGFGGVRANVFTVSSDRTTKIYSLATGSLLLSVSFPVPLTAVVTDTAEFAFYVGSTIGSIYKLKLHSAPRSIEHHVSSDAVADYVFKKHKEAITTLSMSADGKTLASGDSSGVVLLWDTESKQAIKTISGIKAKVTNLLFWLGNPDILKGGRKPVIYFPEVPKLVEQSEERNEIDKVLMIWNRSEKSVQTTTNTELPSPLSTENLTLQVSQLKAELARSEQINITLQEFCVEHVMNQKDFEVDKDTTDESETKVIRKKKKKLVSIIEEVLPRPKKKKAHRNVSVDEEKLKKKIHNVSTGEQEEGPPRPKKKKVHNVSVDKEKLKKKVQNVSTGDGEQEEGQPRRRKKKKVHNVSVDEEKLKKKVHNVSVDEEKLKKKVQNVSTGDGEQEEGQPRRRKKKKVHNVSVDEEKLKKKVHNVSVGEKKLKKVKELSSKKQQKINGSKKKKVTPWVDVETNVIELSD